MESETDSASIVTNLDVSITDTNLAIQYSLQIADQSWHVILHGMHATQHKATFRDYASQENVPVILVR